MTMHFIPLKYAVARQPFTEINLCGWIGQAMPGDVLEYHRGFLAHDVSPQSKHRSDDERGELLRIARRAWWASEKGLVHLVQRRHRDGDYSYLVVARPKPKPASTASSSSELFMEAA